MLKSFSHPRPDVRERNLRRAADERADGGRLFWSTPQMEYRRRAIRHYAKLGRLSRLTARRRVICSLFAGLNPHRWPIGYSAIAAILGSHPCTITTNIRDSIRAMGAKSA